MTRRPGAAARSLAAAGALVLAVALPACVERRIFITSEPTGALVNLNDTDVGRTPLEVDFTYFGVYDVRLSKEGSEPLATKAHAKAPVWEWPIIDLVALLIPVRKVTHITWHFDLEPEQPGGQALLDRAQALRPDLLGPTPPGADQPAPDAGDAPSPPIDAPASPPEP